MDIIIDNNIKLKLFSLNDIESKYKVVLDNKMFLKKWLPWVNMYEGIDDLNKYIEVINQFKTKIQNKEAYTYEIYYLEKFVGSIDIQSIDYQNKKCEIGYWLSKDVNGKGIIGKSCKGLIEYIYDELKLNKVLILTSTRNHASYAIPERLGFVKEGKLEEDEYIDGKFLDSYIYGMTKKRWRKLQNIR